MAYRDQPPERIARVVKAICRLHEAGCHPLDLFAELQSEFPDLGTREFRHALMSWFYAERRESCSTELFLAAVERHPYWWRNEDGTISSAPGAVPSKPAALIAWFRESFPQEACEIERAARRRT